MQTQSFIRYAIIAISAVLFSSTGKIVAQTITETNSEIGLLGGERASNAAKLAAVKQEIQDFTDNEMIPHNNDAAEQRRQLAALQAAGYDATSQASVDAYNQRVEQLNAWGARIDERRDRLTPRYVDMKTREADYTQQISDLENKIRALIAKYTSNCEGSDIEALVNCWSIYFDGEEKRAALPVVVPQGTRFFSQGVPDKTVDAFKSYRNKQLEDIDHKKIVVPPPPPPPQKTAVEEATEKVQGFFKNLLDNSKYKTRRVTNAVLAVRG